MAERKAKKDEAVAEKPETIEKATEVAVEVKNKPVNRQAFVARKLRAINDMPNAAKARRLAARVLNNF